MTKYREIPFDPHDLEEAISQVDVCFVIDTTSSMGPYLEEAKKTARAEAEKIASKGGLHVQYAVVAYRDHPPQDTTYVTKVYPFGDAADFEAALNALIPHGGGDTPEAVWDGLVAAGHLQWRPTADHQCFLIGDAPPHGYGMHSQWPEGCPCKATAGGIIELFGSENIQLNAISIAGIPQTAAAFREVAEGCRGTCVEVEHAIAATTTFSGSFTTTSGTVAESRAYAVTMSTTPGMTDTAYSAATGTAPSKIEEIKKYLKDRKITIPDLKAPKRTTTPKKKG